MFPPVECADDDGLLAVGGDLKAATLCQAYSRGIFPWPVEGLPLLWFAPPQRAILSLSEFHIPRRLERALRSRPFETRVDANFSAVIRACAGTRKDGEGTWITNGMIAAYTRLHRESDQRKGDQHKGDQRKGSGCGLTAHSIGAYRDGELEGGLYGVARGAYFCGESMFHRKSDASKACIIALVEHLHSRGATWLDIQMMTPLFASFGAREVPRAEFTRMLRAAWSQPVQLFE